MVLATPTTPVKSLIGHRRARSQSSTCTPSPVRYREDQQSKSPSRLRARRGQRLFCSQSDPIELDSCSVTPFDALSSVIFPYQPPSTSQKRPRQEMLAVAESSSRISAGENAELSRYSTPLTHRLTSSAPTASVPPLALPSTAIDFNLTPLRRRGSHSKCNPHSPSPPIPPLINTLQMQHDAFGDLRRSVQEGEQRFISHMQEWEEEHSCGAASPSSFKHTSTETISFDDDDVDIITATDIEPAASVNRPQQVLNTSAMDEDLHSSRLRFVERPSSDFSDDDAIDVDSLPASGASASKFEYISIPPIPPLIMMSGSEGSTSTHSSLISLPRPASSTSSLYFSRADKAVAALTLALANGAAGLEDYQDILISQGPILDSEAGSLWG